MSTVPRRRRLRAPQEDGAALIDPPLSQVAALVQANRARLVEFDRRAGFPPGFRKSARADALKRAGLEADDDLVSDLAQSPIILTGHQPELFHPGVWFKHFVASSIAQATGGTAINLSIDADAVRSVAIDVPSEGANGAAIVVEVSYDASGPELPWQSRRVLNESIFRQFAAATGDAFHTHLRANRPPPLLDRLWQHVLHSADLQADAVRQRWVEPAFARAGLPESTIAAQSFRSVRLAKCLAEGRHRFETDLGLAIQELPLSIAALASPFLAFADHLLTRHRELHEIYNAVLADYRVANRVRGQFQPVPDLSRDDDWYEMPFWLWTFRSKQRQRAFVRRSESGWVVSDRQNIAFESSVLNGPSYRSLPLTEQNIVLRPRALLTTMYARLVLSDLFIHGIGGAKYDELTDEIIRRFFGIEPPGYLTATATFRLPIQRPRTTAADVRACAGRIRDLRYRPESFVGDPLLADQPAIKAELESLAQEKRNYLWGHNVRRGSREVFAGLDRLNRAMHDLLRPVEEHLRREHARLIEDERRARLLGSREFSFVLFPEEYLVPRLLDLAKVPA
jgi:hypothetical protein